MISLGRLSDQAFYRSVQFVAYSMYCDVGYTTPPSSHQPATSTIDHGTVLVDRRPMHCRLANKHASHERIAASCGSIFGKARSSQIVNVTSAPSLCIPLDRVDWKLAPYGRGNQAYSESACHTRSLIESHK